MKPSAYNFFFPYEHDKNKLIAYNSFSNALVLMDKDKHEIFRDFCNDGTPISDEEFIGQLEKGRFLIEDDCNELDLLRFRMLKSRYNNNYLSLTIAPTADCNFRCPYCYEKDVISPDYMTKEVEDAVIKLVESQVKTISSLFVNWYGGEPLMNVSTIERLSERFIELCKENGIDYRANIVTNGYLLTEEICKLFNRLKIISMQITLDGSKEIHDVRRPLVAGGGTFDTIVGNLLDYKDILPSYVNLRINIDRENADSGRDVVEFLKDNGLLGKVRPYLGQLFSNDVYEQKKCFDTCDFSEEEFDFYSEAIVKNNYNYMNRYPRPVSNFCVADTLNDHVVGADGNMYKCWKDIGDNEKCIGSLIEDKKYNDNLFLNYMLYDATSSEKCSECNLLPICMGGCPYVRLEEKNSEGCPRYKFILDSYLRVIAKKIEDGQNAVA